MQKVDLFFIKKQCFLLELNKKHFVNKWRAGRRKFKPLNSKLPKSRFTDPKLYRGTFLVQSPIKGTERKSPPREGYGTGQKG